MGESTLLLLLRALTTLQLEQLVEEFYDLLLLLLVLVLEPLCLDDQFNHGNMCTRRPELTSELQSPCMSSDWDLSTIDDCSFPSPFNLKPSPSPNADAASESCGSRGQVARGMSSS